VPEWKGGCGSVCESQFHRLRVLFGAGNNSGGTFSAPVKVTETKVLPFSHDRGPRMASSGEATVISAVGGKTSSQGAHAPDLRCYPKTSEE